MCPVWAKSTCVEAAERVEPNKTGLEAGLLGVCPRGAGLGLAVYWAQQYQLREAGHLQEPLGPWLPLPVSVSLLASNFLLFGLPQPQQPFPSCLPLAPAAASFSSGLRPSPWFPGNKTELSRGVVLGVPQGGRKKPEGVRRPCWHRGVNQREGRWACRWMGLWNPPAVPRGDSTPFSGCGDRDSQESA